MAPRAFGLLLGGEVLNFFKAMAALGAAIGVERQGFDLSNGNLQSLSIVPGRWKLSANGHSRRDRPPFCKERKRAGGSMSGRVFVVDFQHLSCEVLPRHECRGL